MDQPAPSVPWVETQNIYDIKYFNRDNRRVGTVGGLALSKTQVIRMQVPNAAPSWGLFPRYSVSNHLFINLSTHFSQVIVS